MEIAFLRWALIGLISSSTMLAHGNHSHEHEGASNLRTIRVTTAPDGSVNPWNHLDFHNDPNAFQFAIVSDRTGGARAGVFEEAIGKLNLLQPEFVMSVGDLIEGYTHDVAEINRQWEQFDGFISKLEMPFFYVPGNHDQTNTTMAKIWEKRFGRSYYSFVYRDVLFLCLNTQDPDVFQIGEAQAQWVKDTLAEHSDVRWTLVFLHSPLWRYNDNKERGWSAIQTALTGREHTVFAGHFHSYLKSTFNKANYYVLATTGGGSSLRGPAYGEFDQVAWVTMTEKGPVIANLLLDGIQPDDVRTVESKALMDQLNDTVMSSEILWREAGKTSQRQLELISANPTDLPVDVSFEIIPTPGINAQLTNGASQSPVERRSFTLQPKSSIAFNLILQGEIPAYSHQAISGGQIKWQALLQPTDDNDLQLKGSIIIPIVPRLQVPSLSGVVIDGDLQDWPADSWLDVQNPSLRKDEGWTGLADSRFRLNYARDETNLYLSIEVRDDIIISDPDIMPWMQDGIEVRIDFRTPKFHRASRVGESGLFFLGTSPAPGDGFDPTYLMNKADSLPSGTQLCNRQVPGGYNLEIALPISSLKKIYGDGWLHEGLRLNIAVNDRDDASLRAQLWWQPDWRTTKNIPSSGTLFLE